MGESQLFAALVLFILLVSFPNVQFAASSDKPTSFSIRLIDKYSPESPFYPGNLTFLERMERITNDSESRASYMKSKISRPNYQINSPRHLISPYVISNGFSYVAQVRIGEPGAYFYLLLDTGTDMSWVLCRYDRTIDPYKNQRIFNPYKSYTYNDVKCMDHVCDGTCEKGKCVYKATYYDNDKVEGTFGRDSFGFRAPKETWRSFRNILFVCADPDKTPNKNSLNDTGVLAMGPDHKSFTSQMSWYTGGRFSYCLVPPKSITSELVPMSYLKFGNDMGYKGPNVKTIKFLKHPSDLYFLNLIDISVNGKRLNYPPGTFLFNRKYKQGCIIDSGSAISHLHLDNYWKLHDAFMVYFMKFQLRRREVCPGGVRGQSGVQLCYILPDDFTSFPSMTYHFEGGDLRIAPEQTFIIDRKSGLLMLAVGLNDGVNILGAYQQHNTRFVYDNKANTLSFVPENCERDPPP